MIYSMTGYGKSELIVADKKIHVEIRSLNSKQLDLSFRIPSSYREREMEMRRIVSERLIRGKVDVYIWQENTEGSTKARIDGKTVGEYFRQMEDISEEIGLSISGADIWNALVKMPDVLVSSSPETISDDEWHVVREGLVEALDGLCAFRQQEGAALQKMFVRKLDNIAARMNEVEKFEPMRVENIRTRLTERLAELRGVDYDKGRLEQELIYYIEKLDINEEKQRLRNHLKYFAETMDGPISQGKKLGFIAQEMGREINTTGSKSNQAEMQNLVVMMKDELEQIKEQVLNVL